MGLLGDLFATSVNLLNVPAKVVDELIVEDKFFSTPGEAIAKELKKIDD